MLLIERNILLFCILPLTKNKINSFINRYTIPDSYNAKSLIAVDLSNNNDFVSKRANEQQTPASLAKLFVIEYATTFTNLNDIVTVSKKAAGTGGSRLGLKSGDKISINNLLYGLLMVSRK